MPTTQHPTMDTLLAYLDAPDQNNFSDLRLHIASCSDCRGNIVKLHKVQNALKLSAMRRPRMEKPSVQLTEALEHQAIERYIDGELRGPQASHIKTLLQNDGDALKAALHYASHSHGGDLPAQEHTATQSKSSPAVARLAAGKAAVLDRIKNLLDFRPPLWISVPATAAVMFAFITAILPVWQTQPAQGVAIARYQDKAVIHFQGAEQLPGIGFFSKAHSSTQAFGPMEIRYDKHQTLSLQWPRVADATTYHLTLFLIADGQKITVKELDVTAPHASITGFTPTPGKRYEWALNGETNNAKTFYTSGGFVFDKI